MKTVREEWAGFEAQAIPPCADMLYRRAIREAFYAGAIAMVGAEKNGDTEKLEVELVNYFANPER